jgi:phenylacetate-CoA ligase
MCHFGQYLMDTGQDDIRFERIISTAERLSDAQRNFLRSVFEGHVYDLYCTREHGCIGFECDRHAGLHTDAGSVLVETVVDGRPCRPGEPGDIVVTDLLNFGMPLIRYRIGDRGICSSNLCPCGCNLPLLRSLEGRVSDLLYRADGSAVSGLMLIDVCTDMPDVRNLQFIQTVLGDLEIRIEPGPGFGASTAARIEKEVRKYLGSSSGIKIYPVNKISVNPVSGKFQEVICEILPARIKSNQ